MTNQNQFTRPILLVEDNLVDIDLTRQAFARCHVTNPVEVARDGIEALAYIPRWEAGEQLPVIILLDLKLPKIDGLEVLRQLKTHPRFNTLPVIVLTSSSQNRDMQQAYRLGANSYLVKPVNFEKFIDIVALIKLYWVQLNIPPEN